MTEHEWLTCTDSRLVPSRIRDKFSPSAKIAFVQECRRIINPEATWVVDPIEAFTPHLFVSGDNPTFEHRARILRDIVGNPFREVNLVCQVCSAIVDFDKCYHCKSEYPALDGRPDQEDAVLRVARGIREWQAFAEMPILADALEDAGCVNEELLQHCRGFERCECLGGTCPDCEGAGCYGGNYFAEDGTYSCERCGGCGEIDCDDCTDGWIPMRGEHTAGCWVLRLILGE